MAGPQSIKDHGWRQGSVLPAEQAERVAASRFADWGKGDRAVLLSQECDVVAGSTKKIEKALKKNGKEITGIFLAISPNEECSSDEDYQVALRVTAAKETLAEKSVELELVRTTKQIADALDACDGIEVVDHALVSEAAFTLADLEYFQRWDWGLPQPLGRPWR